MEIKSYITKDLHYNENEKIGVSRYVRNQIKNGWELVDTSFDENGIIKSAGNGYEKDYSIQLMLLNRAKEKKFKK